MKFEIGVLLLLGVLLLFQLWDFLVWSPLPDTASVYPVTYFDEEIAAPVKNLTIQHAARRDVVDDAEDYYFRESAEEIQLIDKRDAVDFEDDDGSREVGNEVTQVAQDVPHEGNSDQRSCTIFTFWRFDRPPLFAQLNVESWRRHSHGLCDGPVLINESNVREWLPDMPDEYFRLPYPAADSDMIRYGLLHHHGGLYFDSDFLVVKSLSDIIKRLPKYDLISYETPTAGQNCASGSFSSNFMGGRKGSKVLGAIWEEQKASLTNHCKTMAEYKSEIICCMDNKATPCHIPWAQLGEGISHRVLRQQQSTAAPTPKVFCFGREESFVPADIVQVLDRKSGIEDALEFWRQRRERSPLDRIAYHLFNSNSGVGQMSRGELFDSSMVLGLLYTRSFDDKLTVEHPSKQLLLADLPEEQRPKPRPRAPVGDGGCYNIKDRSECCRYSDGRRGQPYEGHDCVPSKAGLFFGGNVCEPDGWEDVAVAGSC